MEQANKRQLKRRNHTVNKSYLRRFADDNGRLTQVHLPGDKRVPIAITDATVRKNFYVLTLPDGSESDVAEDAFCLVEGAATKAISHLVDEKIWPIPAETRIDIAGWIALQYLRGPWVRQLGREIAEGFASGAFVTTAEGKRLKLLMPEEVVEELTGPRLHLDLIWQQLVPVTRMLRERDWVLTFFRHKSLATSDAPVLLCPPEDHPPHIGLGIANAEIHVALDRRVALSMGHTGGGDLRVAGVARTAQFMNHAAARNARRYVFHHPDDDPLRGLTLPAPRTRELAERADVGALVEHLFQ